MISHNLRLRLALEISAELIRWWVCQIKMDARETTLLDWTRNVNGNKTGNSVSLSPLTTCTRELLVLVILSIFKWHNVNLDILTLTS